jgi:hypothetical protein
MTSHLDAIAAALCSAIAERDAAHSAWLAATWPPTPGNITLPIEAADTNRGRAACDAWATECRRVSGLVDVADKERHQAALTASEISEEVLEELRVMATVPIGADAG